MAMPSSQESVVNESCVCMNVVGAHVKRGRPVDLSGSSGLAAGVIHKKAQLF